VAIRISGVATLVGLRRDLAEVCSVPMLLVFSVSLFVSRISKMWMDYHEISGRASLGTGNNHLDLGVIPNICDSVPLSVLVPISIAETTHNIRATSVSFCSSR